ncbi:MAG: HAMP domain-containing histidine kinase [Agathobacter sp.]|nr:HAMP domain-containing histidine kinase [Agathobacter sp.]
MRKRERQRRKEMGFKAFIIQRFLIILIFIIVAEYLLSLWMLQLGGGREAEKFLICLLPVLIGGAWFIHIVLNEVKLQDNMKEEMRHNYEKQRNALLSDIAHDLRTPMTTIAGYAKALKDGVVTDEGKKQEYLEAIDSKSEQMAELLALLFDYVRMDSMHFGLKRDMVDLPELLRKIAASLYADVEEKDMEFAIAIPEQQMMVAIDGIQFSRVITNLITNAIRHNEPGCTIGLKLYQENEEVVIVVSDDGEIIESKIADHIFEPFIVGDKSRQSNSGSGLGLSIAKKIVDMHEGTLELVQMKEEYHKAFIIRLKASI